MLLFSLILHGVTFILLFFMYQKLQEEKVQDTNASQKEREIEGLFNAYLLELKEENQKFAEQLKELKASQANQSDHALSEEKHTDFHQQEDQVLGEEIANDQEDQENEDLAHSNYSPPSPVGEDSSYEPSPESKILQMHHRGYTADQIAKQVDAGVTEVELIIKFHTN